MLCKRLFDFIEQLLIILMAVLSILDLASWTLSSFLLYSIFGIVASCIEFALDLRTGGDGSLQEKTREMKIIPG